MAMATLHPCSPLQRSNLPRAGVQGTRWEGRSLGASWTRHEARFDGSGASFRSAVGLRPTGVKPWTRSPNSRFKFATFSAADEPGGVEPASEGKAKRESSGETRGGVENSNGWTGIVSTLTLLGFWGGFSAYAFLYSPNLMPNIDKYLLEKLLGLKGDDGFEINNIVFCLWNVMGLLPVLYSMILIPSARGNKLNIPIWPFSVLSFFFGAFALLPYFSIWEPNRVEFSEIEKGSFALKVLNSRITAIVLTLGISFLVYSAFTTDEYFWAEYIQYFNGSRFIHATSLDFLVLTLMLPFWTYNDMEQRKWSGKDNFLFYLTFLPLLGPSIYLILRPEFPTTPENSTEQQ